MRKSGVSGKRVLISKHVEIGIDPVGKSQAGNVHVARTEHVGRHQLRRVIVLVAGTGHCIDAAGGNRALDVGRRHVGD